MRYFVTMAGRTLEVDLSGDTPTVDGRPVDAQLSRLPGTPMRHLVVDGRSHVLVSSREAKHRWDLHLDGEHLAVEVVDERTRAIRAMTGQTAAAQGPRPVRAPMPGLVVRVQVEPGDRVAAGSSVVIIEAMKMENDLKAEGAGVVARVLVEAGQPVEKGAVLVELEAEGEAEGG
ncbi:MAG TPA: acetyl-CoA carboxylase biotin carboxyl carrier protein subunit [Longimicrobiales bacterium]|nr:acetyl-CoA carboxylase biotin carboxyl carrier protein subunit [Longimicrobiales bacterium]